MNTTQFFAPALNALVLASLAASAYAQNAGLFKDADLKLGEQLIAQGKCAQCHAGRVGGDGSAIYKPGGKINTGQALQGMVENCNNMLSLQMFPEEITAVAAVLNRDHYRFK